MRFGNLNVWISYDGEIEVAMTDMDLGQVGRSVATADTRRGLRFAASLIRAVAERRGGRWGTGYLWSGCEEHTYPRLKKLAAETGGRWDDATRYVTWRPPEEK